jgi:hypothetical protein
MCLFNKTKIIFATLLFLLLFFSTAKSTTRDLRLVVILPELAYSQDVGTMAKDFQRANDIGDLRIISTYEYKIRLTKFRTQLLKV